MSMSSFSLLELGCTINDIPNDDVKKFTHVDHCHLCENLRKVFYCKSCVKNGDFIHSTSRFSERFAEKRLRLLQMQYKKNRISAEFDERLVQPRIVETQRENIRVFKENIKLLQSLVTETQIKIKLRKTILSEIQGFNHSGKKNLKKNRTCHQALENNLQMVTEKWPCTVEKLGIMEPITNRIIYRQIQQLVQYIFPIVKVPYVNSAEDSKPKSEICGIGNANENWMFVDSWTESYYLIISSALPDCGNYATYAHYFNTDAITSVSSCLVDHSPAYNISAAFTYITELVGILAYYLDIRLPNKLHYSEFCGKQLNERKFVKCVTLLNANILYLCLSQNVDVSILQPTQTIHNILALVNCKFDECRQRQWVDAKWQYISIFEEQLTSLYKNVTSKLNTALYEESNDNETDMDKNANNDYDSDNLAVEWEALPLMALSDTVPSSPSCNSYSSAVQTTNITSTLMTSAAAGIASIWRGLISHK